MKAYIVQVTRTCVVQWNFVIYTCVKEMQAQFETRFCLCISLTENSCITIAYVSNITVYALQLLDKMSKNTSMSTDEKP